MILVYTHTVSTRLQYVCEFIFKETLGIDFEITTSKEICKDFTGLIINYSKEDLPGSFKVESTELLFEKDIRPQDIITFQAENYIAFFKLNGSHFLFDIFAAVFYLLSRYEEYLPHEKDSYGRFAHQNSLAFKEGFLDQPLINMWLQDFSQILKAFFPPINYKQLTFKFLPTYDIDIAWSFKNKGVKRNVGGFLNNPSFSRMKVLAGAEKDPFDSYQYLHELHVQYKLKPLYFFLVALETGRYDKNISPLHSEMKKLIKEHAAIYEVGLHPSWKSNEDKKLLKEEIKCLEKLSGEKRVTISRQHYIKFTLPYTFEHLINFDIQHDYSMGYGSINGFRASTTSSFYWYDIAKEQRTNLILHPFCFMDANSFYEQDYDAEEAFEELMHYYRACKKVNGQMITIFHNNFLGTDIKFKGWKEMYEKFLRVVSEPE
ncbi:MAG: polysaccharide deacetylase family protein [Ferruginibacter sp.]